MSRASIHKVRESDNRTDHRHPHGVGLPIKERMREDNNAIGSVHANGVSAQGGRQPTRDMIGQKHAPGVSTKDRSDVTGVKCSLMRSGDERYRGWLQTQ